MWIRPDPLSIDWAGGIDEPFRAAAPCWSPQGWGKLSEPTGSTTSDLVVDGEVVVPAVVEDHFVWTPQLDLVGLSGSVLAYSAVGSPIRVVQIDHSFDLATSELVFEHGDNIISVVDAPTKAAAVFGAIDLGPEREGLRWYLVTDTSAVLLPFDGVASAPAPDGSGALGLLATAPNELIRFDADTGTTTVVAVLEEDPDEVFWPAMDMAFVRVGFTLQRISL